MIFGFKMVAATSYYVRNLVTISVAHCSVSILSWNVDLYWYVWLMLQSCILFEQFQNSETVSLKCWTGLSRNLDLYAFFGRKNIFENELTFETVIFKKRWNLHYGEILLAVCLTYRNYCALNLQLCSLKSSPIACIPAPFGIQSIEKCI